MPNSASAIPITWQLTGVRFNDGALASGSFVFDATTGQYSNVSIATTSGLLPANAYTAVLPGWFFNAANVVFVDSAVGVVVGDQAFELTMLSPMTNAGGTIGLALNVFNTDEGRVGGLLNGLASGISWFRWAVAGSITSIETSPPVSSVPEPATLGLCLLGLAGLALTRRRRSPSIVR